MDKHSDATRQTLCSGIWITWERQIRNRGLSEALGFKLYELTYNKSPILRYCILISTTLKTLIKEKPRIVVAQNPSIVLALLIVGLKKVFNYVSVIDAHNSGLKPKDGKICILNVVARLLQKKADITLVTNKELKNEVERNGGCAHILHDKIPNVKCNEHFRYKFEGQVNIVYVCSFAEDEPYREVISCGQKIPHNYYVYITGNHNKMKRDIKVPSNAKLVGYVPDEEYWALLRGADIIMDLTTRENCLVCGAYEGVALGKPLILSNTLATKGYFSMGCIYVNPTVDSIAGGIMECVNKKKKLTDEQISLGIELRNEWLVEVERLKTELLSHGRFLK